MFWFLSVAPNAFYSHFARFIYILFLIFVSQQSRGVYCGCYHSTLNVRYSRFSLCLVGNRATTVFRLFFILFLLFVSFLPNSINVICAQSYNICDLVLLLRVNYVVIIRLELRKEWKCEQIGHSHWTQHRTVLFHRWIIRGLWFHEKNKDIQWKFNNIIDHDLKRLKIV